MFYKVVFNKFLLVISLLFETLSFLKINKRGKNMKKIISMLFAFALVFGFISNANAAKTTHTKQSG